MIQPQELRIGNITNEGIVVQIEKDCFYVDKPGLGWLYSVTNEITPIELTEEWLLNLGFRKSFRGKWEKDELAYDIYGGNGLYMHGVTPEIKYVHQLQNIYFELTGQELTIKE